MTPSDPRLVRATFAVVLARGIGARLRQDDGSKLTPEQAAAASTGSKGLVPIHGRPLLDYLLHELADGGVRDVVFVVAPDDEAIRARYERDAAPDRLSVRFATQAEPRGTADALLAARDAIVAPAGAPRDADGAHHFLVCNADNLYPACAIESLVALGVPGVVAFDAAALAADDAMTPERIRQFALLDVARDGTLKEIVEKPEATHRLARAKRQKVSMNLWRFTDAIFPHCESVKPSSRGELELTDAVRAQIANGGAPIRAVRESVAVPDLSHRRDVAVLERQLAGRRPKP